MTIVHKLLRGNHQCAQLTSRNHWISKHSPLHGKEWCLIPAMWCTCFFFFFFLIVESCCFRVLRPFTPYFIFASQDTLAFGGYFYNRENLRRTLFSFASEHYFGRALCRETFQTAGTILMRMVAECVEMACQYVEHASSPQGKHSLKITAAYLHSGFRCRHFEVVECDW